MNAKTERVISPVIVCQKGLAAFVKMAIIAVKIASVSAKTVHV